MLRVSTQVWIDASPTRVWAVLTDNGAMPSWNPMTERIEGVLAPGERVRLVFTLNGRRNDTVVTLLEAREPQTLLWRGGVPLLLRADHGFRLTAVDGGTALEQHETFTGLMAPLVPRLLGDLEAAYTAVNLALKARCERG
ncbi:MAG: SRPBCC domain-containing protein [Alphaproteobacteria bacterium]|nr:SRPBCC domain-containing protein [Alphaproteobacteria bacterium]